MSHDILLCEISKKVGFSGTPFDFLTFKIQMKTKQILNSNCPYFCHASKFGFITNHYTYLPAIISKTSVHFADDATEFAKKTEKFVQDEAEFVKAMHSASELYDNSLTRNSDDPCNLTVIFQNLISLAYECSCLLNNVSIILNYNILERVFHIHM